MPTDKPMTLGMIGLGRMGANLVRRLTADGHRCVVYDMSADAVAALEDKGRSVPRRSKTSPPTSSSPGRCGS
jgi:6-phosphogluconate dehydrogenase (decarboxylating)